MAEVIKLHHAVSLTQRIERITGLWNKLGDNYVESIIAIGDELIAVQAEHGKTLQQMAEKLPFSSSHISEFISIAQNPSFRIAEYGIKLPRDYSVLAILSQLSEKSLRAKLANGSIYPTMTRMQARELLPPQPERKPNSARALVVDTFKKHRTGLTTDRARVLLPKMHPQTVNATINKLAQAGYLHDTGKREKTRSEAGRKAIVYKYAKKKKPEPVEIWNEEKGGHKFPPEARIRGILWRAERAVEYAELDDMSGVKITAEARRAIISAADAWKKLAERIGA